MPAHVLISNVYADDNRGGAALTAASIEALRRAFPGAAVTLLATRAHPPEIRHDFRHTSSVYPDVDLCPPLFPIDTRGGAAGSRKNRFKAVVKSVSVLAAPTRHRRLPFVRSVLDADIVVSRGGVIFFDVTGTTDRAVGLWLTSVPLLLAKRLGKPVVVYGAHVGPFQGAASRLVAATALKRADLVLVRDEISKAEVLALGVRDAVVREMSDSVFSLDLVDSGVAGEIMRKAGLEPGRFAAVTVHRKLSPDGERIAMDALEDLVRGILDRGVVDRVAIVVQVSGDGRASRALADALGDDRVVVVADDVPPGVLVTLYGHARFTVAMRLHSAIFSLLAGTPAFPFDTRRTHKVKAVFDGLGLGDLVVQDVSVDSHDLVKWVEAKMADETALRQEIRRAVNAARASARSIDSDIRSLLPQAHVEHVHA